MLFRPDIRFWPKVKNIPLVIHCKRGRRSLSDPSFRPYSRLKLDLRVAPSLIFSEKKYLKSLQTIDGLREFWPRETHLWQTKGQTNSKWFFQDNVSSKKTNERIRFYYYDTSGRLVFVHFLEETEDTKKLFRN